MLSITFPPTLTAAATAHFLDGDRATGTTSELGGHAFTIAADNRLFHGDREIQLSAQQADRARCAAFCDDVVELYRFFESQARIFDIRAYVAGHRRSFEVQAFASNFYDACEQAREQLSAKLGVPTSSIATSLSPA